jgi:hypothetical protein
VDSALGLKDDGEHLNGTVDTSFGGTFHPAGFATPVNGLTPHGTAANYHERTGYPNGLADCRGCHGDDLAGGKVNVSCDQCHGGSAPLGDNSHVLSWVSLLPHAESFRSPGTRGHDQRFGNTVG